MTVVNPKSISGINSITMASGSDDLLTIHSNNTTERVRVNNSGDVIVGSGVTLSPDGDIFATGVCTATSFVGSGANLTGISGVSVANQGDNRVITNTGTTDALNAEANLTFDGTTLKAETGNPFLELSGTTSNGGNTGIHINANANHWVLESDNYTSQNLFSIKDGTPDSSTARLVIDSSGNTTISSGNLVMGTAGKGIDFSATSGGANSSGTSEVLDDYEEGDHTVTLTGSSGQTDVTPYSSENKLSYNKIGNLVVVKGRIRVETNSYSGSLRVSLPYTVAAQDNTNNAQMGAVATHGVDYDSTAGTGSHMGMFLEPIQNTANAEMNIVRDNSSWAQATNSNIAAGNYLAFTLMYRST